MEKEIAYEQETSLKMIYELDDDMSMGKSIVYGLQHLIYFIAGAAVMPVIVGGYLGLNSAEVASLLQRTFFFCGVLSMLQLQFGHRYPITDGPAGLWIGMLIIMAGSAISAGKSLAMLRAELELGMMIAGSLIIILAVSGAISKIARLFTPIINGIVIVMMVLQISPTIIKGMTGVNETNPTIDPVNLFVFVTTALVILLLNQFTTGFLRSISTLVGVCVGWILAFLVGNAPQINHWEGQFITIPQIFAWGKPSFDPGIVFTCILASLALFSMVVASITGMGEVVGEKVTPQKLKKSTVIYGTSAVVAGLFPTVGYMPYVSSTGVIAMTRVASRKPFFFGCLFVMALGFFAPVGAFFSSMPPAVGYAATLVIFSLIFGQGLKEFQRIPLGNRENYIIGISILIGVGVMFLPNTAFSNMPQLMRYILSNGLVDGVLVALFLENVLLRKKREE
ncbi:MAG TPA: purine/pyrimidine permease [Clostridiales bacterium]|nr:purine/pyrimidine permease [Clostridiales bacterium]